MGRFLLAATCALAGVLVQTWVAFALTSPTLTATASGSGAAVSASPVDVAQLSGSTAATGTLTFRLYGPDDAGCARTPYQTMNVAVNGDGTYIGNDFVNLWTPGEYQFTVTYSGDAQNASVSTSCGDPAQRIIVTSGHPRVIGTASASVAAGGQLTDAARVVEGAEPTGDVRFDLYGPDDPTCATIVASSTASLGAFEFRANSAPYTATRPGVYRWIASYLGDGRNTPAATACGDSAQTVTVTPESNPAGNAGVSLEPAATTTLGDSFTIAARVTTASRPGGTLTFRLYGPGDTMCSRGTVAALVSSVSGSGRYSSAPFSPTAPGTYVVVASFVGEDGATASTTCADPAGRITVQPQADPEPEPDFRKTFTVEGVDGRVFVSSQSTGSGRSLRAIRFVEVREKREVPLGSIVDTRKGHAKLEFEVSRQAKQDGTFYGTKFKVSQPANQGGLTELDIRDAAANRSACRKSRSGKRPFAAKRLPKTLVARIKGRAKGKYRTRGRNSSASVKGTTWEINERCDGTLTKVVTGVVKVFDPRRGVTRTLRAGDSLLVREP